MLGDLRKTFQLVILVLGIGLVLTACGSKEDEAEQAALEWEDKIVGAIDSQDYEHAIAIVNTEMPKDLAQEKRFQLLLAHAHLGLGGLDPVRLSNEIASSMVGKGNEQQQQLLGDCTKGPINKFASHPPQCWTARLFIILPNGANPNLESAESIFFEQQRSHGGMSLNNKILFATLKTARILDHVSTIFEEYLATGEEISRERAQTIFAETSAIAEDYRGWFRSLNVLPSQIHEKLTGTSKAEILARYGDELHFIEETGVPHMLETMSAENRSIDAKLTRIFLLKEIEFVLADFFGLDLR